MHCADSSPVASKGVVLVADDDDAVRTLIARILRGSGYTVLEARSSDEAMALGDDLELLVADLVMPSTGGVELAEAMQARIPGLHVLFTSGYCRTGSSFGPDDPLLAKPFTAAELLLRVRKLVGPTVIQ
jgi:two-component system, cell cycle sensor histidine kinase and response regulator CckA